MARHWALLGLGPLAFSIAFGLSLLSERDFKQASFTGITALSAVYAGGLVATKQQNQAAFDAPCSPLQTDSAASKLPEIAVFWDYENIRSASHGTKAPLAESLIAYSKSQGHPRLKRVYANWRREKSVRVAQALYGLGFETVHVSTGKQNSADIKLSVDCLTAATQHRTIEKFIIVTSDRDFVPLINTLKNTFKREVILVGNIDQASDQILLSADEFVDIKELDFNRERDTVSYEEALDCLVNNINLAFDQRYSNTSFGTIDRLMRADPDYSYGGVYSIRKDNDSTCRFRYFKDFIAAAEADGEVIVSEDKELFLPEYDSSEDEYPEDEYEYRLAQDQNLPQALSSIPQEECRVLIDSKG